MKRFLILLGIILGALMMFAFVSCGEEQSEKPVDPPVDSHKHSFGNWVTKTEPTCEESGVRVGTCSCGQTEEQPLSPIGHLWDTKIKVDVEPTCKKPGSQSIHCLRTGCGAIKPDSEQEIPTTEHEWVITGDITKPTCTTPGRTDGAYCSVCGEKNEGQVIPALGHDFKGAEVIITEANCTTAGQKKVKCTRCDETELQTIKALGHSWDAGTDNGTPNQCGDVEKTYKCTVCNVTETKFVGGDKHEWSDYEYVSGANCYSDGVTTKRTCSKCNREEFNNEPLSSRHFQNNLYVIVKEPTASEEGIMADTCSSCGEVLMETAVAIPKISSDQTVDYRITVVNTHLRRKVFRREFSIKVLDASNQVVGEGNTIEQTITFPLPSGTYKVEIEGIPTGYHLEKESYEMTAANPLVYITLVGQLREPGNPDYNNNVGVNDGKGDYYRQGDVIRDFTFYDYDNNEYKLSELLKQYKFVVFEYYYTTCGFCQASFEDPQFRTLFGRYRKDIKYIFVNGHSGEYFNQAETKENVMSHAARYGFDKETIVNGMDSRNRKVLMEDFRDPAKGANLLGFPSKFVIDSEGVFCYRSTGYGGGWRTVFDSFLHFYSDIPWKKDSTSAE